jgi:uncharacterized protein YjbI with pentapeptide repeats
MSWWMIMLVTVAATAAFATWWWVPRWQARKFCRTIRDAKARADVEDNFRKTVGQVIGGAAVLLTAGLAYYQTQQTLRVTIQESELSRQAADEQSKRSVAASRALLLSQQVSKGFEDLGSDHILIQVGGIYALEGIMQAPETQYHLPVLEALCAFVRDRTRDRKQPPDMTKLAPEAPPTDLRAALAVIGRRPADLLKRVDLAGVKLWGMVLQGMNLIGADLHGADLSGADLHGADLHGADLSGANLHLTDLHGANLSGTILFRADLSGAILFRADLSQADLHGISLIGANLKDANLVRANLNGSRISDGDLSRANLNGANLVLADLSGADLSSADLSGALLSGANFSRADLNGAQVLQVQLDGICGTDVRLRTGLTVKQCN